MDVVMPHVTELELATAFTEWDRRYREEPDRFQSEARRLLKSDADTYGKQCAPYLLAILAEQTEHIELLGARDPDDGAAGVPARV